MQRGFTLIELLVVIAIVGLLASVVLASLNQARTKAQYTVARTSIQQLANLADIAKGVQSKTFMQLSGSGCTECACRSKGNIQLLPRTDSCWTTYLSLFTTLNSLTNGEYSINTAPADPWGAPYLFNENEGETYPVTSRPNCYPDIILSAGPNGLYYDSDDIVYNIPSLRCSPSEGVHHPNTNWY